MASLDVARRRTRTVGMSNASSPQNRAPGVGGQPSRVDNALDVGKTMLTLMLVALAIVALRYVLVLLDGVLH